MTFRRRLPLELGEVVLLMFLLTFVVIVSLPFLIMFAQSTGFRWLVVLVTIWLVGGYLGVKIYEETGGTGVHGPHAHPGTSKDRIHETSVLLARGEVGYTLSQDVVYQRMAEVVRKNLSLRGISDIDAEPRLSGEDRLRFRALLAHEKRKGSRSMLKRLGLKRDREFIPRVRTYLDIIEGWMDEDI